MSPRGVFPRVSLAERFWSKVEKTDGCWLWTGVIDKYGYGAITVHNVSKKAHRIAWELTNGPIPPGLCVLHSCIASRSCVALKHLRLGTHAENAVDREAQGRHSDSSGEKNGQAKLTASEVREIRDLRASGALTGREVARLYGVTPSEVSHIFTGKVWKEARP